MSRKADPSVWSIRMGAGWFLDWGTRSWTAGQKVEYWQTVRFTKDGMRPNQDDLVDLARKNPGMVWIIGNEPDNSIQDNLPPEQYAEAYHALFLALKGADPSAKIAIGAVTQPTPLRFQYLDRVLAHYSSVYKEDLPVDWWTIHAYVLREERGSWGAGIPVGLDAQSGLLIEPADHGDIARFKQQLIDFRIWMKANGYQDKPLAVTEFGILLPESLGYTPQVVADYLKTTFEWLDRASDPLIGDSYDEYRLVQRWAWFSLADDNYPVANLASIGSGRLTQAGEAFRKFTLVGPGN